MFALSISKYIAYLYVNTFITAKMNCKNFTPVCKLDPVFEFSDDVSCHFYPPPPPPPPASIVEIAGIINRKFSAQEL